VLGRDAQDLAAASTATLDLLPGQVLDIRNGQPGAVRQADATTLSAWREGWLVFENTPLAEALATVNAYRTRPIEAADARVAALRLTGRFRANDSAGLLAVLPSILPLRVRPQADGGVQLQAL
jgi:transmembrane sensor